MVSQNKDAIIGWIAQQDPDIDMINFALGRKWGTIPVKNVARLLNDLGIDTSIVVTGGRKRIQMYGIALSKPIAYCRDQLLPRNI